MKRRGSYGNILHPTVTTGCFRHSGDLEGDDPPLTAPLPSDHQTRRSTLKEPIVVSSSHLHTHLLPSRSEASIIDMAFAAAQTMAAKPFLGRAMARAPAARAQAARAPVVVRAERPMWYVPHLAGGPPCKNCWTSRPANLQEIRADRRWPRSSRVSLSALGSRLSARLGPGRCRRPIRWLF